MNLTWNLRIYISSIGIVWGYVLQTCHLGFQTGSWSLSQ